MVDSRIKKRLLITVFIAALGELGLLFYIAEIHTSFVDWQFLVGSLLLITGILLILNLIPLKKTVFKNSSLIFYAIIVNPGFVSIFAGITGLTIQNPQLRYVYFSSAIIMILGIIIGFGIFVAASIEKVRKPPFKDSGDVRK